MTVRHFRGSNRSAMVRTLVLSIVAMGLVWSVDSGTAASGRKRKSQVRKQGAWHSRLDFRTIDGTGNNPIESLWGSAGIELLREPGTSDYGDGVSSLSGPSRMSARAISNLVASQPGPLSRVVRVTDMLWQWGQFLDHDIDLTGVADVPDHADIAIPTGDPIFDPFKTGTQVMSFTRSAFNPLTRSDVREQMNMITSFIDASNVYGSDAARASALRGKQGYLKMSRGRLLPFNVTGLPNAPHNGPTMFLAGDVRANEQVGLTAMHTLFVREHNRLVRTFRRLRLPAETRYQLARTIVSAEMQAITFREFLPLLLGGALPPYAGYDPSVNPAVSNIFATGAYRFGHTMVSPTLLRLKRNGRPIKAGHLALRDAFFSPKETIDHGIEPVLRGLVTQRAEGIDNFIVDDMRNFLFAHGSKGFDLSALNIQRGRDHGLPDYNASREQWGLPRVSSFAQITPDVEVQRMLAAAYASVDDIDRWWPGWLRFPMAVACSGHSLAASSRTSSSGAAPVIGSGTSAFLRRSCDTSNGSTSRRSFG